MEEFHAADLVRRARGASRLARRSTGRSSDAAAGHRPRGRMADDRAGGRRLWNHLLRQRRHRSLPAGGRCWTGRCLGVWRFWHGWIGDATRRHGRALPWGQSAIGTLERAPDPRRAGHCVCSETEIFNYVQQGDARHAESARGVPGFLIRTFRRIGSTSTTSGSIRWFIFPSRDAETKHHRKLIRYVERGGTWLARVAGVFWRPRSCRRGPAQPRSNRLFGARESFVEFSDLLRI